MGQWTNNARLELSGVVGVLCPECFELVVSRHCECRGYMTESREAENLQLSRYLFY